MGNDKTHQTSKGVHLIHNSDLNIIRFLSISCSHLSRFDTQRRQYYCANHNHQEKHREIKDIFSDEVFVKPDEEGDAGIIYPIFQKGRGEDYLYVMVPVDKKGAEIETP